MPKGKKAKGKKVAPTPAVMRKQEAKKVVNLLFEKRLKSFGYRTGYLAQKEPRLLCQMAPLHPTAAAKG